LRYMMNVVAGLYTNGQNGFSPLNGPAYVLYMNDPQTGAPYTSWAALQSGNVANYLAADAYGLYSANPTTPYATNALDMYGGYLITARAALADEITYTQSPQAIQAFGNVGGQNATVWASQGSIQAAAEEGSP